jgi:tRNA A37 threonylcarbamoyltransferase TsaD
LKYWLYCCLYYIVIYIINPMLGWWYKNQKGPRGGCRAQIYYALHYRMVRVMPISFTVRNRKSPSSDDIKDEPLVINLSVPFTSTTEAETNAYAQTLANSIIHYHQQGKKVVIRLVGKRGAGKSTIISKMLRYLTCSPTADIFGAITFIGVKEYVVNNNGNTMKVVHIDPDVKNHQRLISMHSRDWNVLLLEHGTNPAFMDHDKDIKEKGENVVDITLDIAMGTQTNERVFTLSSATGAPVETFPHCKWKGNLDNTQFSPDIRLNSKQVRHIRRLCAKNKLGVLVIESSCDDTCITIRIGDVVIYEMQLQCIQQGQLAGKQGIDPMDTALKHKEHFEKGYAEVCAILNGDYTNAHKDARPYLQAHGLTIDLVSVTKGPGQNGALTQGLAFAQFIANKLEVPMVGVDHIEGHAMSPLLCEPEDAPKYPYLVFVVSGGHTVLLLVESATNIKIVYTTPNDAIGEMFDKICRALGISAIPAGPFAEKLMEKFLEGLWKDITSKTTDDVIKSKSDDQSTQQTLLLFRDSLKDLDACTTPSAIKATLCTMIGKQKVASADRIALLATYVRYFSGNQFEQKLEKDLGALLTTQDWKKPKTVKATKGDELPKKFQSELIAMLAKNESTAYEHVAHETLIVRLLEVLNTSLFENKDIQEPIAFLHAFLVHFNLLETVSERDISYMCRSFSSYAEMKKDAGKILEQVRATSLNQDYASVMQKYGMPTIPLLTFMRNFEDMTPLPETQQQFYCALVHSKSLAYLSKHFLEAIAMYPHIKYMCLAGGVACNRFLQNMLKALLEKEGRKFAVVPIKYCSDNAHMIWILTMEKLRKLFADAGECTCKENTDEVCSSCATLPDVLFQYGFGNVRGSSNMEIAHLVDVVRHCSWDRWNSGASHKMAQDLNVLYDPKTTGYTPEPDLEITVDNLLELLNDPKNGKEGTILFKVRLACRECWASTCDLFVKVWQTKNQDVINVQLIAKDKREAIMLLISTNFFGHGYDAFASHCISKQKEDHIVDVNALRRLIR